MEFIFSGRNDNREIVIEKIYIGYSAILLMTHLVHEED